MTKKKDPTITKSEACRNASLSLQSKGKGVFSKESRDKMRCAKIESGRKQKLRNPKHAIPHLKVVYLHYHRKTREYFWCGHGHWSRPTRTSNRTKLWKDYVSLHGPDWEVITFQSGINAEMAWWLEKNLTRQIGTVHDESGPLLNHDGKRGCTKQSNEFRQKVSKSITEWHKRRKHGSLPV
jgi:hypothetical protein